MKDVTEPTEATHKLDFFKHVQRYQTKIQREREAVALLMGYLDAFNTSLVQIPSKVSSKTAFDKYQILKTYHIRKPQDNAMSLYVTLLAMELNDETNGTNFVLTFRQQYQKILTINTRLGAYSGEGFSETALIANITNKMSGWWTTLRQDIMLGKFTVGKKDGLTLNKVLTLIDESSVLREKIKKEEEEKEAKASAAYAAYAGSSSRGGYGGSNIGRGRGNFGGNSSGRAPIFDPNFEKCRYGWHNNNARHTYQQCVSKDTPPRQQQQSQQQNYSDYNNRRSAQSHFPQSSHNAHATQGNQSDTVPRSEYDRLAAQLARLQTNPTSIVEGGSAAFISTPNNYSQNRTALDSGASVCMARSPASFLSLTKHSSPITIKTAGEGADLMSYKGGTLRVVTRQGQVLHFSNALLVPNLAVDLISVASITKIKGATVGFEDLTATIRLPGTTDIIVPQTNGSLYYFDTAMSPHTPYSTVAAHGVVASTVGSWHKRLGHANSNAIHKLASSEKVRGIRIVNAMKSPMGSTSACYDGCYECSVAKSHQGNIN